MSIRVGMDIGAETVKTVILRGGGEPQQLPILATQGQPLRRAQEALNEVRRLLDTEDVYLGVTGAGAAAMAGATGAEPVDEPSAMAASLGLLYPDVRTVVEMGREGQKYLLFDRDEVSGRLVLVDANLGDKCAAGSGAFLDHMAKRLNFGSITEFAQVALDTEKPATLSGRCSVFTESDVVHLYQKGTSRERIAAGVHQAICRNYRSRFIRGKDLTAKVAFVGGVSENPAAVQYLASELSLNGALFVPKHNRTLGAIGAALRTTRKVGLAAAVERLKEAANRPVEYAGAGALRFDQSDILPQPPAAEIPTDVAVAALGVDIGSVSTKAALVTEIDGELHVLASYYRRTDGDPLVAVRDTVGQIYAQVKEKGYRIGEVFAATTGSGRYLTADYIGADLIKNEITAQAHGAMASGAQADTIFEIGGQDSKYIRLDGSVVTGFEMNKACAAGCGAFLEKQAARLGVPIDDFGDKALAGANPPMVDWTCTVFTESAMVYYQQAGVPIEDLCASVCLASVKNYLQKNLGGRDIGGRIMFQGAVAFNKGMVAAFETVLGRKVTVPPYPHLTGAIGAARIAFRQHPEKSSFRGFEGIAAGNYAVTSFECQGCPNACDVNAFQMEDGPKYYYNDRCEKFSGLHKKGPAIELPDLFEEREKMLLGTYSKPAPAGAKKIGVPRGLMFSEYFPLYKAFLTELGFEVVISEPTNKRIIGLGLGTALGEPCFPFKVAHGHYADLVEQGIDTIWSPGVIATERPNPKYRKSCTCPYLQASPELFRTSAGGDAAGVKTISPRIHYYRGKRHLIRVFTEAAKELGKTQKEAKRALEVGLVALQDFRDWQSARGKEILESLGPDDVAFVVVGRPYSLYDAAVNMQIGKKIRDMGILAIPQDMLPLANEDITDSWPDLYSRQVQKAVAAARIIRQDARLRAVLLTYFACGPDSFSIRFFKDELAEPCCVIQMDEHTADAGVITRMEAYADTAIGRKSVRPAPGIITRSLSFDKVDGRRLWIPYGSEAARVLAATLRAYGLDAEALPRSPDPNMDRARAAIFDDVCVPALYTTEDMLYRISRPDFDPKKECFFIGGSEGPCRYGMYYMLQRRILDKMGLDTVDIITLPREGEPGNPGTFMSLVGWDALVTHDLLQKMQHKTRPYEVTPGATDELFKRYVDEVCEMLPAHKEVLEASKLRTLFKVEHLTPLEELLQRAQADFDAIPRQAGQRPIVGVVGEFFVRIHDGANQNVVRKIEQHGGEAWLAPATEFFIYSNRVGQIYNRERFLDTLRRKYLHDWLECALNQKMAMRDEHRLVHAASPALKAYHDISSDEVMVEGAQYTHPSFGGEAICSIGKAEDFAKRGLAGIVAVKPFNCMPGNVVTALSSELRRRNHNIPFLNLDYDGFMDSSRDIKLANFMCQVRERFEGGQMAVEMETATASATPIR